MKVKLFNYHHYCIDSNTICYCTVLIKSQRCGNQAQSQRYRSANTLASKQYCNFPHSLYVHDRCDPIFTQYKTCMVLSTFTHFFSFDSDLWCLCQDLVVPRTDPPLMSTFIIGLEIKSSSLHQELLWKL